MAISEIGVAIIGAGAAGLSAAVYAARGGITPVVFEGLIPGGQANITPEVENYLGFYEDVSGPELMRKFHKHAEKFGCKFINEEVLEVKPAADEFLITTGSNEFSAKKVILATGAKPAKLNIKGEDELLGKGVSYCATCDGNFFKGKKVAVIGGGNTAVEDALLLSKICDKVYLIHRRDKLRADKVLVDKLMKNDKIEILWKKTPTKILGDIKVRGLRLDDDTEMAIDAVFVAVGITPILPKIDGLNLDEKGFVKTDNEMQTNIQNLFAAGDIRSKSLRQIITAASDGAIAGSNAVNS